MAFPDPAAGHDEPADAEHVHDTPVNEAGTRSLKGAPTTADGPAFDTTIWYVTVSPGWAKRSLSVLVTDRSTSGDRASTSVAELLAGLRSVDAGGAATVAVFDSVPVDDARTSAVMVKVALPPAVRSTVVLMLPAPPTGQLPPTATQLHTAFDRFAARASTTDAPITSEGPLLETTTVYVTDVPGTSTTAPSVFEIARSVCGVNVSTSVAVLLEEFGSFVPAAAATVAVLVSTPTR